MLHLAWTDFLPFLLLPTFLLCRWKLLFLIRKVSSTQLLHSCSAYLQPALKVASPLGCHFCIALPGGGCLYCSTSRISGLGVGLSFSFTKAQPSSLSYHLFIKTFATLRVMPFSCIDLLVPSSGFQNNLIYSSGTSVPSKQAFSFLSPPQVLPSSRGISMAMSASWMSSVLHFSNTHTHDHILGLVITWNYTNAMTPLSDHDSLIHLFPRYGFSDFTGIPSP